MLGLRFSRPSVACAVLGGLALAVACKDDSIGAEEAASALADVLCSNYYDCNCPALNPVPVYTSEDQCLSSVEAQFQVAIDEGTNQGLTYDGRCVKRVVDFYDSFGCKTPSQLAGEDLGDAYEVSQCKWFYGEAQAGQACVVLQNSNSDNCAKGLHCENTICVADRPLSKPGETCDGQGGACAGGALCLDLNDDSVFVCESLPTGGQTCLGQLDLCAEGYVCDQTNKTCVSAPGAGQPCDLAGQSECATGLVCDVATNTCQNAPTGGQACVAGQCASGFMCVNNVCAQEAPLVCSGGAGRMTEMHEASISLLVQAP